MLQRAHRHGLSRIAAVLTVLMLSGVVRVATMAASTGAHRCCCKAHGAHHECNCPICQAAALAARFEEADKLPPCHRAAARAAIAREAQRRAPRGPSLTTSCQTPDRCLAPVPGVDPFVLTGELVYREPPDAGQAPASSARPREALRAPEPPPPRSA